MQDPFLSLSPEVMTADEVALFLRVDRKSIYAAAQRNGIPHRRMGKRILFSRAALTLWLSSARARRKAASNECSTRHAEWPIGSSAKCFAYPTDAGCESLSVPTTCGLPNTKVGAEEAERLTIARVLSTGEGQTNTTTSHRPQGDPHRSRVLCHVPRAVPLGQQGFHLLRQRDELSSAHQPHAWSSSSLRCDLCCAGRLHARHGVGAAWTCVRTEL
jgi:excisionase family DNA binding protein